VARRGDLNGWWRFGIAVVGILCRVLFRPRVTGARNIPATGPGIVAGNHVSAIDGVLLALVTAERGQRMTRFLVAAEFFNKKRVAWALRLYRQIPLPRPGRHRRARRGGCDDQRRSVRRHLPEGKVNPDPRAASNAGGAGSGGSRSRPGLR
jgi:1-acyl-sn-glycerol-3-phosphate acyltransferase